MKRMMLLATMLLVFSFTTAFAQNNRGKECSDTCMVECSKKSGADCAKACPAKQECKSKCTSECEKKNCADCPNNKECKGKCTAECDKESCSDCPNTCPNKKEGDGKGNAGRGKMEREGGKPAAPRGSGAGQ